MFVLHQKPRSRNRKENRDEKQSAYKCSKTGIISTSSLFVFKSTVQRNPINLLPWFSRMEEVHDLVIY